jgi:hypothetical protein
MSVIIIKQINPYVNTVPVSAETGTSIRNKLQSLTGDNRLDVSAIKGLGVLGAPTINADNIVESSTKVLMLRTERDKLANIATNANNYVHPTTHPSSMIVESSTKRFVSDSQVAAWDNKQDKLVFRTVGGQSIIGPGADISVGGSGSGTVDAAPIQNSTNAVSSGGVYTSLLGKVDAVSGKVLSSNDYTTAEKSKLAAIPSGATQNSSDAYLLNRVNHTGTQSADSITDGTNNKAYTAAEKAKLAAIQSGATANSSDSTLLNRTNHIGTQVASTISDFQTSVSSNTNVAANTAARHSHPNKTVLDATTASYTTAEQTKLNGINPGATVNNTDAFLLNRTNHIGTQAISTIEGLQTAIDAKQNVLGFTPENVSSKGAANGYAPLGPDSKVPSNYLPAGAIVYKGTWNAATNTPSLNDATGTAGWEYNVAVGGTQNLGSGNITFSAGDWVIHNGTVWQKTVTSSAVSSVNGQSGAVVLTKNDIGLGNVDNISAVNLRDRSTHTGVQSTASINFASGTKILGRITATTGVAEELTPLQVTSMLDLATTSVKGLLSGADKTKLDSINSGATANSSDSYLLNRLNHTGTQSADTIIDGTNNKVFTSLEKTKLSGVAAGATANSADAFLLNRVNHTGTQSADSLIDGTTNKAFLATERTKLAGIATGATVNSSDAFLLSRANHTGNQSADTITDGTTNKAYTAAEKTKLAGIASGATANSTDAQLLAQAASAAASASKAASTITEDSTHRFVSDAEKNVWNSKQAAGDYATNTTVNTKIGSTGSPVTISNVWVGSQAQYDAITTPSASVLYFIQ